MNVLITGGAGFIGSHLADKLLEKGHRVCAMDNLSTGNLSNIEPLMDHPRFSFVPGSILDESLMRELIDESDMIYHLAAAVGVKYIMENPLKTIQINVRGTEILLELASVKKQRVLIASTSEVYGKNGAVPYKETSDRLMGATSAYRWSYACTKALDEFLALAYWDEKKLPAVIVRFFNTCGVRQTGRYGMVVPRFVEQALKGEPLIVHGDGTQSRCFTDVSDAVRAVVLLMENSSTPGEVFNIGGIQEIAIRALAERVIQLTGSRSSIQHIPYEEVYGVGFEDMKRRIPDITKIKQYVGWEPQVSVDELLLKVINYYRH
ncbi:MAG: GDP-mannose 4,6-dehydratase [Candidatus Poribacteria bacterium]|nr:GDP-mannose 4,6-dehydratase [Candidatus Poribacteria bacterium]